MVTWKNIIHFCAKGNPIPDKKTIKSEEEWQKILTADQFRIARKKGTERPHSDDLCTSHEEGLYGCVCCKTPLFDATIKFNSGTGWPSFTQPIKENAIKYERDITFRMVRVEAMCNSCDAHLGHVFPDGPAPSGLRFCVNSESLELVKKVENE